jgi:hypothetical protein
MTTTTGRLSLAAALVATLVSGIATPRVARAQGDTTATPAARPNDVASATAVVHAAYDVISGPAGTRDWDRFLSLFAPGARLIPTVHDTTTGTVHLRPLTPREFAKLAAANFAKNPFYESEVAHQIDSFGAISQVFSTYASRRAPDDKPFSRGINSFQLFNDGKRWYIVTIYWDTERANQPIPDRYLHDGQ